MNTCHSDWAVNAFMAKLGELARERDADRHADTELVLACGRKAIAICCPEEIRASQAPELTNAAA